MNIIFLLNKNYYKQKEGLGMGLPLAPTMANIFMCNFEITYLDDCPWSLSLFFTNDIPF